MFFESGKCSFGMNEVRAFCTDSFLRGDSVCLAEPTPVGGSLPSPFLARRPWKDRLQRCFLLLFSLGFLSFNVPPLNFPSSSIMGGEPTTRETPSGTSQSQKTWASLLILCDCFGIERSPLPEFSMSGKECHSP